MTDIDELLRNGDWPPPREDPLARVERAVSRSTRRRRVVRGLAIVLGIVVAAPAALAWRSSGDHGQYLIPADGVPCPPTSEPTSGPSNRLFPADAVTFRVCEYTPDDPRRDDEPDALVTSHVVPADQVAAVARAFGGLKVDREIRSCGGGRLPSKRYQVVAGYTDRKPVSVGLQTSCSTTFYRGRTEAYPTAELRSLLGLDPTLSVVGPTPSPTPS